MGKKRLYLLGYLGELTIYFVSSKRVLVKDLRRMWKESWDEIREEFEARGRRIEEWKEANPELVAEIEGAHEVMFPGKEIRRGVWSTVYSLRTEDAINVWQEGKMAEKLRALGCEVFETVQVSEIDL